MQHELHYSLVEHLKATIGVPVVWIYDGVTLPTVKPFITVEQMQNNNEVRAKRREAIETIYRFQVGLFTTGSTQRAKMQSQIKDAINYETITLYQTDKPPATAIGFFDAFVTNEAPITASDTEGKTLYHRVYFDVEIQRMQIRN